MKTNVRFWRKSFSSIKKKYLYKKWYLAVLKKLDIRRWVIIALRFSDYIVFLETLFFTCILFLCLLSKRNEWLSLNGNLRHAIQNHWMSSNSVACSQRWRLCFVLFCLELFLARPSWFLLVMACSELFCFLQATTSQNVLIRKFTINQLHFRFY